MTPRYQSPFLLDGATSKVFTDGQNLMPPRATLVGSLVLVGLLAVSALRGSPLQWRSETGTPDSASGSHCLGTEVLDALGSLESIAGLRECYTDADRQAEKGLRRLYIHLEEGRRPSEEMRDVLERSQRAWKSVWALGVGCNCYYLSLAAVSDQSAVDDLRAQLGALVGIKGVFLYSPSSTVLY